MPAAKIKTNQFVINTDVSKPPVAKPVGGQGKASVKET